MLAGLQAVTPNLVGNDSYFHIKYAEVMRHAGARGFPPAFPWLPLTILAPDRYADHHMLYHVLLVPFTIGDLRIGGKIAAVAGAVAMVGVFVWVCAAPASFRSVWRSSRSALRPPTCSFASA